jgi:hypothetical protein
VNADHALYLNGQKNVSGLNLYSYCLNCPVFYYDPYGTWVLSVGIEGEAACGIGAFIGGAVNIDGNWNVVITFTIGVAIVTNVVAYYQGYIAYYRGTNNASQLSGWGISVGVSFSMGVHLSGGGSFDVGFDGSTGGSLKVGIGRGASLAPVPYWETRIGHTGVIRSFNLLSVLKSWANNVTKSSYFYGFCIQLTNCKNYVKIYLKSLKTTLYVYKNRTIKVVR